MLWSGASRTFFVFSSPFSAARPGYGYARMRSSVRSEAAPFSALTAVVSSSGRSFAEASATWAHLSPKLAQMLSVHRRKFVHALCQEWELATAAVVCAVTDTRSGQVGC